jgi:hypothetical protein
VLSPRPQGGQGIVDIVPFLFVDIDQNGFVAAVAVAIIVVVLVVIFKKKKNFQFKL